VHLVYGANYVIAKGVMPDVIGPSGFVMARILGAVCLFWIIFAFKWERVARKDLILLFICSVLGIVTNQVLFLNGLNLTSPINASLIMITIPISVFILSIIFFKEKVTTRKVLGIILGSVGFATLVVLSNESSKSASLKGDILCMINAISYAGYLVLIKTLMGKYRALTILSWLFLFGSILIIPIGYEQFMVVEWSELSKLHLFSILYVVIAVTFVVYFLNIYALNYITPTKVSAFTYLQPIFAGVFAFLYYMIVSSFDPEVSNYASDITLTKVISAIIIFVGVYLVSFEGKKQIGNAMPK
ncbi:MAG: DMT family transporter, partial [Flavobacteriales bacterium]|nr:DMT family transporter [Flavobacteriales bacterium]